MAGAFVDHARGELLPPPPPPKPPAPGTDAELTKNVPPSPWKLGEITKAAFSFAKNAIARPGPLPRPLNPPRPGPDAERTELLPLSESSPALRRPLSNRLVPPARAPKPPPNLPASPPVGKSPLRPAALLASRNKFVSPSRCAIGSYRERTSRVAPFSTIFPSRLPLSFSISFVPPSK